MAACICLPTSIGEAIDKLTILDIKLERITDVARKADVQREHDALLKHSELNDFIQTHADLYNTMKRANAIIWNMMDVLRDGATRVSSEEYLKTCKDCIEFNDIRFRIKNRINQASNSELREQKSYKTTVFKLVVVGLHESHSPIVQRILQRPMQYYGILYDEVQIVQNQHQTQNSDDASATLIFNDDISHIMSDETLLMQYIYSALNVSDALMDNLL
jgi:hypothetical protein